MSKTFLSTQAQIIPEVLICNCWTWALLSNFKNGINGDKIDEGANGKKAIYVFKTEKRGLMLT